MIEARGRASPLGRASWKMFDAFREQSLTLEHIRTSTQCVTAPDVHGRTGLRRAGAARHPQHSEHETQRYARLHRPARRVRTDVGPVGSLVDEIRPFDLLGMSTQPGIGAAAVRAGVCSHAVGGPPVHSTSEAAVTPMRPISSLRSRWRTSRAFSLRFHAIAPPLCHGGITYRYDLTISTVAYREGSEACTVRDSEARAGSVFRPP